MTTARDAGLTPDLHGAFRRFYVWRDADGTWHAQPLPKPTSAENAYGILPELVASSPIQLAYKCTWQRGRRNVYRYLQETAERSASLESVS